MLLLCFLITSLMPIHADATPKITVYVSNKLVSFPDAQPSLTAQGRVLVPLRFVSEALMANVNWDGTTQTATVIKGDTTLKLTIGNQNILVDGKATLTDAAPLLMDGRVFVPLRFPAQFLGSEVEWLSQNRTVLIDSKAEAISTLEDAFTLLIYMNGTDLESSFDEESNTYAGAATEDLYEILKVGSTDQVNLVIETGGTNAWAFPGIDSTQNQRWLVQKDQLVPLTNVGRANMGAAESLTDFITWGKNTYPAQAYGLILWNHGGGPIVGYGVDELFEGDALQLPELQEALLDAKLNQPFEFIGFDACLMASIETANTLAPFAKYLVASQELEPGHGWDYSKIASYLTSPTSAKTGAAIGRNIADGFSAQAKAQETDSDITLSVIDLSKLAPINTALEQLMGTLSTNFDDTTATEISKKLSATKVYGANSPDEGYTDLHDLGQFAKQMASYNSSAAASLQFALGSAVVYQTRGPINSDATGLSLYLPHRNTQNINSSLYTQNQLEIPNNVVAFSKKLASSLAGTTSIATRGDELTVYAPDSTSGHYQLDLTDSLFNDVAQIYLGIYQYLEGGRPRYRQLGYDILTDYDDATGYYTEYFDGSWTLLGNEPLSLKITYNGDTYVSYTSEMLLNGERVALESAWYFDDTLDTGGYYTIVGARKINLETQMPDRNLIILKPGDRIQPIYTAYYFDTEEWEEELGNTFTYTSATEMTYNKLGTEDFLITFMLFDIAGNVLETDYLED